MISIIIPKTDTQTQGGLQMRWAFIVLGGIFLALGVAGIFLPILPTTPFLLLTAGCWVKSSPRLYRWLLNNKWFGSYIKNWRENKCVPLKAKILALVFTIFATGYSFCVVPIWWVRVLLVLIVSFVIWKILSLPTCPKNKRP